MKSRFLWVVMSAGLILVAFSLAAAPREPAQSNFKNIQVLKGMSDGEIQRTMQAWVRQLGVNCVACHVQGDFSSDEKPEKLTARKMYGIVQMLNEQDFFKNLPQKADCYLCHKGAIHPERAPGN
jgi:hypothetical protein